MKLDNEESDFLATFFNIGPAHETGMGRIPLPWTEIEAYARLENILFENGEAALLRKMSAAYLEGVSTGENPLGIEPVLAEDEEDDG